MSSQHDDVRMHRVGVGVGRSPAFLAETEGLAVQVLVDHRVYVRLLRRSLEARLRAA